MDSAAEDLNPIGSVYSLLPEVQICLARDLRDLARHSLCGPAEHSGDAHPRRNFCCFGVASRIPQQQQDLTCAE